MYHIIPYTIIVMLFKLLAANPIAIAMVYRL